MDRIFYTLYDPAEDVHWCNDKTTTSNVMNATWFHRLSDAKEALGVANEFGYFEELEGRSPPYEIVKHTLVSERLV